MRLVSYGPERDAREDGGLAAVSVPEGGPVVTDLVAVFDVVVDEREVVHKLDRGGDGHGLVDVATERFAGQEAERGPQALGERRQALRRPAEVGTQHLVDGGVAVWQRPANLALNGVAVAIQDFGAGHMGIVRRPTLVSMLEPGDTPDATKGASEVSDEASPRVGQGYRLLVEGCRGTAGFACA